ncbi:MAG: alpha/beta hydrolase-fold protein [Phycisphaerales bacterium]
MRPRLDDDGLDAALREHLVWITLRSDLLSRHWGRDTFLRCGVALPKGYHDVNHPRRSWPAIYVVPGFGGRDRGAVRYVRMLHTRGAEELAPPAVHIVLDPEGPYGHHGFADSVANGPVGTALVTELIPYLERRFRLIAKPEARFVTGHSSGAWSALWLTLHAPETFGGCWASAPDPVDFHAFQMTDLYRDPSLFEMADGTDTPSFRTPAAPGVDKVRMTVRQEIGVEHAMAPDGDSGQQWGAWLAMFSALDATTGKPRWMIDPVAGTIHPEVIALDWSKYDIAKLVDADWERYKAILPRIRLAVGTQDSFYLNRAVTRWRNALAQRQAPTRATSDGATPAAATAPAELPADGEMTLGDGPGYIWIIRNATHDSIMAPTTLRWAKEMRQAIEQSGL